MLHVGKEPIGEETGWPRAFLDMQPGGNYMSMFINKSQLSPLLGIYGSHFSL